MPYTIATAYNLGSATSGNYTSGTNVGQTGDLSNWYYWTCPTTGYYQFNTRSSHTSFPTTITPFLLGSSPHTPVISGDLTNVTSACVAGGREGSGYGFELGGLVALSVTAGQVLYFQVNNRTSGTGDPSTGTFGINWEPYSFVTLGACGTCTPAGTGLCKIGSVGLSSLNLATDPDGHYKRAEGCISVYFAWTEGVGSFGTLSSGYYYLLYCGGAVNSTYGGSFWGIGNGSESSGWLLHSGVGDNYAGVWWSGTREVSLPSTQTYTAGELVNYGGTWYSLLNNVTYDWVGGTPGPDSPAEPGPDCDTLNFLEVTSNIIALTDGSGFVWPNQQAAEASAACLNFPFCHAGGTVKIAWFFNDALTINDGSPDPAWSLFLFSPSQQIKLSVNSISCTGATGSTYHYSVTVKLTNTNTGFSSGNFTLKLQNTGDITGASANVSISSIAASGHTTATFTFDSTAINTLTGTFQFLNCNGDADGTQNLPLASAVVSVAYGNHISCGGSSLVQYGDQYNLRNSGVIPCVINFTITAPSVLLTTPAVLTTTGESGSPPDALCTTSATVGSLSGTTATIPPSYSGGPAAYIYVQFGIKRNGSGAPTSQTITVSTQTSTGGVVFAPFTHTETLL